MAYRPVNMGGCWMIEEISGNRVLGTVGGYFDTKADAVDYLTARGLSSAQPK